MSLLSQGSKVVYRHRRNDDNSVFYVGLGEKYRPYNKNKRNSYWKNIVSKCGYSIEILAENLSLEDAADLEMLLIKEYGRKNIGTGILCNMTDGGEGIADFTPKVRKEISERRKGVRTIPVGMVRNAEWCRKISESKKGKVSAFKGRKHTEKTKAIIKQKRALQVFSEESLKKKSLSMMGGNNPFSQAIIDTESNIIYPTMREAAQRIGLKYTTLSAMLNGYCRNKTNFIKLKDYEFIEAS